MNKFRFLAISVSLILTACGGEGGNSDTSSTDSNLSTTSLLAMDGYLQNAVVFIDANNDGVWQATDEGLLGLTDSNGQLSFDGTPQGTLAIQTLIPDGDAQAKLISLDREKYADIYTIDIDQPSQPMQYEVVLRAPAKSTVISPITDLVSIEMANGASEEEAISTVITVLGSNDTTLDLYADYIGTSNLKSLHKMAQILTQSKAFNSDSYSTKAIQYAAVAATIVDSMEDEKLNDVDYKPVIIDSSSDDSLQIITNTQATVNTNVKATILSELDSLSLTVNNSLNYSVDLSDLFDDSDNSTSNQISISDTSISELNAAGITAKIESNQLVLSASQITLAGTFPIILSTVDTDSEGNELGDVNAVLSLKISAAGNQPPILNKQNQIHVQSLLSNIELQQGREFNQTFYIYDLFTDPDDDQLTYSVSTTDSGILASIEQGLLYLSGTPNSANTLTLTVKVSDGVHSENSVVTFLLPVSASSTDTDTNTENADTSLTFTNNMFTQSKIWRMGSFNVGSSDFGYATFRIDSGVAQFCWVGNNSLTGSQAGNSLWSLDQSTASFTDSDCTDATVNSDGSLSLSDKDASQFTMHYHFADGSGDKIIFSSGKNLFWLDSSETKFGSNTPIFGSNVELSQSSIFYILQDDDSGTDIAPQLKTINLYLNEYNEDSTFFTYVGEFTSTNLGGQEADSGLWDMANYDTEGSIAFSNTTDSTSTIYYGYRDFGEVSIYLIDNNADSHNFGFVLSSLDTTTLQNIYTQWSSAISAN